MAGTLGPRGITTYGYSVGENGWGTGGYNPSMANLDTLCQLSVVSANPSTTPPTLGASDDGKAYIVPSGATGAWSGKTNYIALWDGTQWLFYNPAATGNSWINWTVYDNDTGLYFVFGTSSAWVPIPGQLSGTYASRPTAATKYNGTYYLATDIGSGGALFECQSAAWKQIGVCMLASNNSNVTITTTAETSVFSSAPSLPAGCIGVGTRINWGWRSIGTGAGAYADPNIKVKFNGTTVSSSGVLPTSYYQGANNQNYADGSMVFRTIGAGGSVMSDGLYTMEIAGGPTSIYHKPIIKDPTTISDVAATTVDTTAGSPDVTLTLANLVNSPTANIKSAFIFISGLV